MHERKPWAKPVTATKRITGRKLQALRKALFAASPLCVMCEALGRISEATQRDHIKPLADGGKDDEGNVQALCVECHDAKSQAESIRSRRR